MSGGGAASAAESTGGEGAQKGGGLIPTGYVAPETDDEIRELMAESDIGWPTDECFGGHAGEEKPRCFECVKPVQEFSRPESLDRVAARWGLFYSGLLDRAAAAR